MPTIKSLCILVAAQLALGAAPLAAEEVVLPSAAEQRFAEVADAVCNRQIAGEVSFGGGIDADTQLLNEAGLMFGVAPGVVERMGLDGVGLISQSILGGQQIGDDYIIVAVGGRLPGCRTILLRKEPTETGESAAAKLAASGWTEVPATNTPGASILRRIFVRRDTSGQPFMLNLYAGTMPESDVYLVSTVSLIPANATLPEGF